MSLEIQNQNLEREACYDSIYRSALAEHPEFQDIQEGEIKRVIQIASEEIERLERLAGREKEHPVITPEIAEKITAIWIFSGPGTYTDSVSSSKVPTRYHSTEWMWGMDRRRVAYGAFLMRKIAEMKSGSRQMQPGPISEAKFRVAEVREGMAKTGPDLIYNGADVQNEAMYEESENNPDIIIPKNRIHILGKGLYNTVDQIKPFVLPDGLHKPGGEIGLVSHAPHLMRIAHIMNRYQPIPLDMKVRLFPIATPAERKEEYKRMEIKGLLYYVFLSKDHDATPKTYPYIIQEE